MKRELIYSPDYIEFVQNSSQQSTAMCNTIIKLAQNNFDKKP